MKDKFRKWKRWLAFLLAFIVISTTVMGDVSFVKASPEAEETAVIEEETEETAVIEEETEAVEEEQEESAPAEEAGSAETPETPEAPKDGLASESAETVPDATETEQQEDESASETEQQMPEDPEAADAVDETDAEGSDPSEEDPEAAESDDTPEELPEEQEEALAEEDIMMTSSSDLGEYGIMPMANYTQSGTAYVGQWLCAFHSPGDYDILQGSQVTVLSDTTGSLHYNRRPGRQYISGQYGVYFEVYADDPGKAELELEYTYYNGRRYVANHVKYYLTFVDPSDTSENSLTKNAGESESVISQAAFGGSTKGVKNLKVVSAVSSNGNVATVTQPTISGKNVNYNINAVSKGTADITVTYTYDYTFTNLIGTESTVTFTIKDIIHVTVNGSKPDPDPDTVYGVRQYLYEYVNKEYVLRTSSTNPYLVIPGTVGEVIDGKTALAESKLDDKKDVNGRTYEYRDSNPASITLVPMEKNNLYQTGVGQINAAQENIIVLNYYYGEPEETTKYTVTYIDGVPGEEVFPDQSYEVEAGNTTPAFQYGGVSGAEPVRDGYKFEGWTPTVAETVTEDATYEATWSKVSIHTVTYEDDKGNEICSERITDDTVAKSADDPEFAGKLTPPDEKEFAGWDADGDGEADYQPEESIPTDKGDITLKPVWKYTQKITDLQKEWIKSADGLPEDIDVDGVAFANENGRVTIPKGGSVKLLFKITVSGNPGTDYTVTDEDAVHAGGDPMEGTIPEDGDAVIYVTKEYQESDKEVSISDPDVYYFTNTAKVEPGKETDNSTDSVQVLVDVDVPGLEDGDLTITKTASKEEVLVGEEFTYTLKVQNNTPDSVEDLIITDVLPDGIELSGELPERVAESEGTLTWSVGTLGVEDAESVEIPVKATKYGKITNTVTAAVGGETVPTDDGTDGDVMSATVEVRIPGLEDGDLTLTKTASAGTVTVGSPFQYTLSVANNTGVDIPNVSVTDELPVGVELVSGQTLPSGVTYDEENRTITWNIDNLSANDTQSITFSVTATAAGMITNDMSAAVMADKAGEDDGTSGTSQTVPTTPTDPDNPGTTDPDADQQSVDVTVNPVPTTPGGGTGGGTGGGGGDTAPTPTPATAPPVALVAAAPAAPAPTAPAAPAPTAPAPAPAVENIADENVPLADGEDASVEPLTELEDEEVPLAGPLDTLHTCCILHLLILLLAMIVEIFYTSSMKKHQRKIFEIRRETAGR